MRAILGEVDKKDSAYILVIRGIDVDSVKYLEYHSKKYPTWGCLLFPEFMAAADSSYKKDFSDIHKVFSLSTFSPLEDGELIEWVKANFPPYNEDEDDEVKADDVVIGFDPAMDIKLPKVEIPFPPIPRFRPMETKTVTARMQVSAKDYLVEPRLSGMLEHETKRKVYLKLMEELIKNNLIKIEKVDIPMGGYEIIGTIDVIPRE